MVGSYPCEHVKSLIGAESATRGIYSRWNVDDSELDQLYAAATIAVAPVVYGAGVNGKIVEALRYGLPCVTTVEGSRGLGLAKEGVCVGRSAEEFAEICIGLINDHTVWLGKSNLARTMAYKHFREENLRDSLTPLLPQRVEELAQTAQP
jgi:glycosyltransferase involved in cell wall biosynthesis